MKKTRAAIPVSAKICAAIVAAWPTVAAAQMTVCNRTFDIANVALGLEEDGQFRTRGWWKIGPNQCADLVRGELELRYVYVYALDVFGRELLPGTVPLCLAPDRFEVSGAQDCLARGHLSAPFVEIDVGDARAWRMFLATPPE